jgi:hypothetical protein
VRFRHHSPVRACIPPFEIPSCLVLSRNSGCPAFRGSFGRPSLPEIRFRSLATPVTRCPLDSSIRLQLRLPVAAPVSFAVLPGPRLPAAPESPFRSPKFDFSPSGSTPSGPPQSVSSMEPVFRNGLSLACNGCSLSEASIPGSIVLACYFKTSQLVVTPGPPLAPLPPLVCPS